MKRMRTKDTEAEPSQSSKRTKVNDDREMLDTQEVIEYEQIPGAVASAFELNLFKRLPKSVLINFSQTCHQAFACTACEREKREKRAACTLLLPVVQGNEKDSKRLIEITPGVLLSSKGVATDFSCRTIEDLTPFQAALCAGDVEMCEMMKKEGFDKLKNGQVLLEDQFNQIFPNGIDLHVQKQKVDALEFDAIDTILQAIIDASPEQVTAALNKQFDNNLRLHLALDNFRKAFTNKSLSETVFNPYHLLRAFVIYDAEFNNLGNAQYWDKRDLFWRQVIGYAQRYLPTCYAQAFAQGLDYILDGKEPLYRSLKFRYSTRLFFPLADSSGLGFDFAVDERGLQVPGGYRDVGPWSSWTRPTTLTRFYGITSRKHIRLRNIIQSSQPARQLPRLA